MATLYKLIEKNEQSLQCFEKALKLSEFESTQHIRDYLDICWKLEKFDEYYKYAKVALELGPDEAINHYNAGIYYRYRADDNTVLCHPFFCFFVCSFCFGFLCQRFVCQKCFFFLLCFVFVLFSFLVVCVFCLFYNVKNEQKITK